MYVLFVKDKLYSCGKTVNDKSQLGVYFLAI